MATATANPAQVVIKITKNILIGAARRRLSSRIGDYLTELADSDVCDIRGAEISQQLPPDEETDDSQILERRNRMTKEKKARAELLLAQGIPPTQVATRLGVSEPTVYRIQQMRKKAAQPQRRRLVDAIIDELVAEYRNGAPVTTLAWRFNRSPSVLLRELRARGVTIRRQGPKPLKKEGRR